MKFVLPTLLTIMILMLVTACQKDLTKDSEDSTTFNDTSTDSGTTIDSTSDASAESTDTWPIDESPDGSSDKESADLPSDQESNDPLVDTDNTTTLPTDWEENEYGTAYRETLEKELNQMTLDEKIAQLLIVDFHQWCGETATSMNETVKENLISRPVGGFIFFKNNCINADQTKAFISDLQEGQQIPLWIAVDEEGGEVSRVGINELMGVTHLDSAHSLALDNTPEQVETLAQTLGTELKNLGFNMDFAPVADTNTNPANPIIGVRAFSSDPLIASTYVESFVHGLEKSTIASVAKHFPGHGDTATDSHLGQVFVSHDINRLRTVEWIPFQGAIESGVTGIMVAHIHVPKVTESDVPATFSKVLLTDYLRGELGYSGLIITDALNMKAISDYYTPEESAVLALQAGADILLMPTDYSRTVSAIKEALVDGRLDIAAIDASVLRILDAKSHYME